MEGSLRSCCRARYPVDASPPETKGSPLSESALQEHEVVGILTRDVAGVHPDLDAFSQHPASLELFQPSVPLPVQAPLELVDQPPPEPSHSQYLRMQIDDQVSFFAFFLLGEDFGARGEGDDQRVEGRRGRRREEDDPGERCPSRSRWSRCWEEGLGQSSVGREDERSHKLRRKLGCGGGHGLAVVPSSQLSTQPGSESRASAMEQVHSKCHSGQKAHEIV